MEKNTFAELLDFLFKAFKKVQSEKSVQDDLVNVLPKPATQDIGEGIIVWRWPLGNVLVESVYITREDNPLKAEKNSYHVTLSVPESETHCYSLNDDIAKELGQAILSAYNWKNIWKLHAGDFLLETLSVEPLRPAEPFPPASVVDSEVVPEVVPEVVDAEPVETVPSFDNG